MILPLQVGDSGATGVGVRIGLHCNPIVGHVGQDKTLNKLMAHFCWLYICSNVHRLYMACHECQLLNSSVISLHSLPLIEGPLQKNGMDLIRPLDKNAQRYSLC